MVLCIHHLLTLLCMCVCAHTLSSNLYLHPTQPVCCYLCIFQPPRQHTFITAPDSGIGNLSLILISLKLQFTWIFVGVLRADCSLADGPGTLALVLSLSLSPCPWGWEEMFPPNNKASKWLFNLTSANVSCWFFSESTAFSFSYHKN